MRLFYWKGVSNFGDQLNPLVWNRYLPDAWDDRSETLFLGIGTLINDSYREYDGRRKVVLGAGVGYGSGLPAIDDSWEFLGVRGPRSAEALRLDPGLAIIDPGVLVSKIVPLEGPRDSIGFMPHWAHHGPEWQSICSELGIVYLDPLAPLDVTFARFGQLRCLLAEAMHGAIVAEAFRIPWLALSSADHHVPSFKWEDWCASVGLTYAPVRIPHFLTRFESPALRMARNFPRLVLGRRVLSRLVTRARYSLAREDFFAGKVARLEDKIERLRSSGG